MLSEYFPAGSSLDFSRICADRPDILLVTGMSGTVLDVGNEAFELRGVNNFGIE